MIGWTMHGLLLSAASAAPPPPEPPLRFAQIVVREQIIIRVPARRGPQSAPADPVEWKESKGPRCVPAKGIAGATLRGENRVDFLMRDGSRVRAELENSCPALDYYYGFYVTPNPDGKICQDRDTIRSRMGGRCEIERFRSLSPRRRK